MPPDDLDARARRRLADARVRVLTARTPAGRPDPALVFFSSMVLRLEPAPDPDLDTMATDGRRLYYSPAFVASLTPAELVGVLLHETCHACLLHFARMAGRDHERWNVACDCAVNDLLERAGVTLPACRLMPGEGPLAHLPRGLSAEAYYARLTPQEVAASRPGRVGDVRPLGPGAEGGPGGGEGRGAGLAAGWAVAATAAAAAAAQGRGELPAELARLVGEAVAPTLPWAEVLREFVARTARADYSWARPTRRFVAAGLYLPGLASDELGEVLVGIDTSGSVDAATLAAFERELNAVLAAHPFMCARVVYCDAKVHRVDTVTPTDLPLRLDPVGGGGTDHDPLFAHVEAEGWEVSVAVLLTDGHTRVTCPPPPFDVLWAVTPGGNTALPFGRVVRLG